MPVMAQRNHELFQPCVYRVALMACHGLSMGLMVLAMQDHVLDFLVQSRTRQASGQLWSQCRICSQAVVERMSQRGGSAVPKRARKGSV